MLTQLTDKQTALLPVYRDKWSAIGLSTEPTNRDAAVEAVGRAYQEAKLAPPLDIIWESSPYAGAKRAALLASPAPDALLRDPAKHAAAAQEQLSHACYGSQDAAWLAFYNYFLEVCNLDVCERLLPLMDAARHLGWWWPFESAAVLTPKPSALHLDAAQRLHCEDGPALDYDGTWGVWSWHGTRVPRFVIEDPSSITADMVVAERNAEVARVMLTRMGESRFALESKAQVIHQDIDGEEQPAISLWNGETLQPKERRLLRIDLPHDPEGAIVLVQVRDPSTGYQYLLRVPPSMQTCHEAVAWTYGFVGTDADNYQPLVEA